MAFIWVLLRRAAKGAWGDDLSPDVAMRTPGARTHENVG
jgi:hypothetical protein